LPRCLVAVDRTYAGSETTLHDGAELAIIPPVSGGTSDSEAPFCRVSPEPINVAALLERVSHGGAGGVVIFLGNVRGRTGTVSTERLEYEAYPEMAESKLSEIMASATDRWPGVRLAVAHRVGVLGPGETSVVVAASAPHRDAAFEAARFTIDQLKTIVPIWKKEVLADGRSFWVDHA
jgi:molybdopterin synthase catalytic subunit